MHFAVKDGSYIDERYKTQSSDRLPVPGTENKFVKMTQLKSAQKHLMNHLTQKYSRLFLTWEYEYGNEDKPWKYNTGIEELKEEDQNQYVSVEELAKFKEWFSNELSFLSNHLFNANFEDLY